MTEESNKSMTPEKPFWSGKGVLSSSTVDLGEILRDMDCPFLSIMKPTTFNKWENKVVKGKVDHSTTIELYLSIHNARRGVGYVR